MFFWETYIVPQRTLLHFIQTHAHTHSSGGRVRLKKFIRWHFKYHFQNSSFSYNAAFKLCEPKQKPNFKWIEKFIWQTDSYFKKKICNTYYHMCVAGKYLDLSNLDCQLWQFGWVIWQFQSQILWRDQTLTGLSNWLLSVWASLVILEGKLLTAVSFNFWQFGSQVIC